MIRKTRALSFFALSFAIGVLLFPQTEDSTRIFEQNKEGVIALYVYGGNKELIAKGVGFGLSADVVATSYHLVSQAEEVEGVNIKGKKMKIEGIIAVDKNLDVALLKLKGKVSAMSAGNAEELQSGARVFALGANESGD
ncbi:MAG: trypsin-like peptidase domain-containing protein, partial [Acidobacteriota bacterium]